MQMILQDTGKPGSSRRSARGRSSNASGRFSSSALIGDGGGAILQSFSKPRLEEQNLLFLSPISDNEIEKILLATEVYPNKGIHGEKNR